MESDFSNEDLTAALVAARVGAWSWKPATGELRWSRLATELLGVAPGAAPRNISAFLELLAPEDREPVDLAMRDALSTKTQRVVLEFRVRDADGATQWLEGAGEPRLDERGEVVEVIGTLREMTKRKLAELELYRRGELLRLVSELASDYVYDALVEGQSAIPTIVAGSFERTTGYTIEDVQERGGWLAVIHPDDLTELMSEHGPIATAQPFVAEYRIRAKDGSERWLRDRGRPMVNPATGALERIVGGVQDITGEKRLEAQLLQAQKMAALARLAGNVAHDFNNVLTILGALLESVQTALERNADVGASIQEMYTAIDRGVELTSSLLSFGRVQPAAARAVDLRSEIDKAKPMMRNAMGSGVALEMEVEPAEATPRVKIDPSQLQFALINLAINARDAMDGEGRVHIGLRVECFEQDSPRLPADLRPGHYARVDFTDTGTGIAQEELPRIFEPYFTTKPAGAGTGLGLAIVYGVTRKHHGAVTVRSTLGVGTTFSLLLPLAEEPPTPV